MNFVNMDKAYVDLEDVDFADLEIGERINRYEYTDAGFQLLECYSYPIIYDGEVVLIATAAYEGSQFEIGTFEADAIRERDLSSVAFVYDAAGFHLYDGTDFELVLTTDEPNDNRAFIADLTDNAVSVASYSLQESGSELCTADLSVSQNLRYHNTNGGISTYSINIDGYYSCTVDYIAQTDETNCWAACIAMIVNYLNSDNSETCESVASAYPSITDGASLTKMATIMKDFGFSYSSSSITMTDEQIVENIDAYYPIIGGFCVVMGANHATVIDAIYPSVGYIRVCDPASGRKYVYRSTDESHEYYGEYTYVSSNTGNTLYMNGQVAKLY